MSRDPGPTPADIRRQFVGKVQPWDTTCPACRARIRLIPPAQPVVSYDASNTAGALGKLPRATPRQIYHGSGAARMSAWGAAVDGAADVGDAVWITWGERKWASRVSAIVDQEPTGPVVQLDGAIWHADPEPAA